MLGLLEGEGDKEGLDNFGLTLLEGEAEKEGLLNTGLTLLEGLTDLEGEANRKLILGLINGDTEDLLSSLTNEALSPGSSLSKSTVFAVRDRNLNADLPAIAASLGRPFSWAANSIDFKPPYSFRMSLGKRCSRIHMNKPTISDTTQTIT